MKGELHILAPVPPSTLNICQIDIGSTLIQHLDWSGLQQQDSCGQRGRGSRTTLHSARTLSRGFARGRPTLYGRMKENSQILIFNVDCAHRPPKCNAARTRNLSQVSQVCLSIDTNSMLLKRKQYREVYLILIFGSILSINKLYFRKIQFIIFHFWII